MTRHPLYLLTMGRLRMSFREPSTIFWAFGFPILLSIALLASVLATTGIIQSNALLKVDPAQTPPDIYFYAPETIYVNPATSLHS